MGPLLLHILAWVVFACCTYYDMHMLFIPDAKQPSFEVVKELAFQRNRLGGRWKYLTIWGLTAQLIYYFIALLNDVLGTNTFVERDVSKLQRVRDVFFTSIAFPIGLLVSVMFWGLFVVDRELVFPAILDPHYPWLLNHGVHTMPLVLGVLELMTERHNYAANRLSISLLCTFLASYLGWTLYLALAENLWVYGIMRVLGWPLRIAFIAANLTVTVLLFFLGKRLDALVWGSQKAAAAKAKAKKSH
ncbi:androgen-induced gene 1 protein-like [Pollicipes pollicipes]|uniref:androgen-induced gene 1 protein-like n=1 Tax=Pollicipes pollicipes TaxID=41117 RepID=UPI0018854164|nr:androgen-induced gene 1 protein-like [Pollicipes pollicipes]